MLDKRRMSVEDAAYEKKKEKKERERGRKKGAKGGLVGGAGSGEGGGDDYGEGGENEITDEDFSEEMEGRTRKMSVEENRKLSGLKKMASVRAFVSMGKTAEKRKSVGTSGGRGSAGVGGGGGVETAAATAVPVSGGEWEGEVVVGEDASWTQTLQHDRRQSATLGHEFRRQSGPFAAPSPSPPTHFDITAPESPLSPLGGGHSSIVGGGSNGGSGGGSHSSARMYELKEKVARVETRMGAIEEHLAGVRAQLVQVLQVLQVPAERAGVPGESSWG
jgi:hypothetical protein